MSPDENDADRIATNEMADFAKHFDELLSHHKDGLDWLEDGLK